MGKSVLATAALLMIFSCAMAQYKKVNTFNKGGRIYELGGAMRLQSGERGNSFGYHLSWGRQSNERRLHHWLGAEIMFGAKYEYAATSIYTTPPEKITVSGKSGPDMTFKLNVGYFLVDNSNEGGPVLPFIYGSAGYMFKGGRTFTDYTTSNGATPDKFPWSEMNSVVVGGGLGILYRANSRVAIRLSGSYNVLINNLDDQRFFIPVTNHPVITFGVRFRMDGGEEE